MNLKEKQRSFSQFVLIFKMEPKNPLTQEIKRGEEVYIQSPPHLKENNIFKSHKLLQSFT